MPAHDWNPERYLSFADERLAPAVDLIQRLDDVEPGRIADLGCGAGNVTALLAGTWPDAEIVAIDSSPDMLARAARDFSKPEVTWIQSDIQAWRADAPFDLIFSNAALHWLDHHETLFPALMQMVSKGGALAVQMPCNYDQPSHTLMADVACQGPWADKLAPVLRPNPVAEPSDYIAWLKPIAADVEAWVQSYPHTFTGDDPVLEWIRSTALKPLLDALDGAERAAFVTDYAARLREAYPKDPDGLTHFQMHRLFLVARA